MRYPASEKLEIIKIVEQSHLPAKKTLDQLGIARRTFYRWYDRYVEGGPEALEDRPSRPNRVWNRISPEVQSQIIDMALEQSELSPRELAVRFTDEKRYFVSEATVYRLLKAHDLITSPAFVVIKAADEFRDKTMRPNEMWQTDFTYFKIIGWGWVYLSTVLDDFSRYIIAWKLCTTMRAQDVTETLELALTASGCDSARVLHKPKLLSDNGPSYIASELAEAKRLREEAQALLAEYQKKRVDAECDAVNIIEQAKREAEAFAVEARAKLSETLDRRSRQAEQKIAQAEAQAVKEVRNIATDLAVAAAGHLIGATAKGDAGNRLIDDAISQVKWKLN